MSPRRSLLVLIFATPAFVVAAALAYMVGMTYLEGEPRGFGDSLLWASETLTTTGYGRDDSWQHPAMVVFVVITQFVGIAFTFVVFSLIIVPYFERRFEGRLSRKAPRTSGYVLIYRYGSAVSSLLEELKRASLKVVVLEEDEAAARRLIARGVEVVFGALEEEDPEPEVFAKARTIVANGTDQQNAAIILTARQQGYEGEIIALADEPLHRMPMMLSGATSVYTPLHILAAAMASLASERISPRVSGIQRVGGFLHTAELRISRESPLAGSSLADADLRGRTGATVIATWRGGDFNPSPDPHKPMEAGTILLAVGSESALSKVEELATPLHGSGPIVVCGFGAVGSKVVELLLDAEESLVIVDRMALDGVEIKGDILDQRTLERASVADARAVVLCLGDDNSTLFAASVIRHYAPRVPLVARVNRADFVDRMHRAGCDFVLSLSEVAGELLTQKLLGADWLSLEGRVRLEKVHPGTLAGHSPAAAKVGERVGVSIVAVQRDDEVWTDFDTSFIIEPTDVIFVCGPEAAIHRYIELFSSHRWTA